MGSMTESTTATIVSAMDTIQRGLESGSNDGEHDALVDLAELFSVTYRDPDGDFAE